LDENESFEDGSKDVLMERKDELLEMAKKVVEGHYAC